MYKVWLPFHRLFTGREGSVRMHMSNATAADFAWLYWEQQTKVGFGDFFFFLNGYTATEYF